MMLKVFFSLLLNRFSHAENLRTFDAHSEDVKDFRVLEVCGITIAVSSL